jgi:hypothetical protein
METVPHDDFLELINHLFLPPKLPQSGDGPNKDHVYIIACITKAVAKFRRAVGCDLSSWQAVDSMMKNMHRAHQLGWLDAELLQQCIQDLPLKGTLYYTLVAEPSVLKLSKEYFHFIYPLKMRVSSSADLPRAILPSSLLKPRYLRRPSPKPPIN